MFKRKANTSKADGGPYPRGWLRGLVARQREKGQGFVELGLSLVFLIILLSVVIDLGWAFFTVIALRDSVQEAGSAAAICPTDFQRVLKRFEQSATAPIDMAKLERHLIKIRFYKIDSSTTPPTETQLCQYDKAAGATTEPSNCNVSSWSATDNIMVEVKVTYYHDIVTPLVGQFIGNQQQYALPASSVNSVLTRNCRIDP